MHGGAVSNPILISGSGLFTPPESISNEELVDSFNRYVRRFNDEHASEIAAGTVEALQESTADFIRAASGIESRRVMDKRGILDPEIMAPRLRARSDDEPSVMCEIALAAADEALAAACRSGSDIDMVLVGASNLERPYPAVAIEVQDRLGASGFAFDLNVACSSATFALQTGVGALRSGAARCVLIVNPEICSGHLNFRDRDSHFIFGDACTALVLEGADSCEATAPFEVLGTKLQTRFSNNIRNNFGFLNRATPETIGAADKLFVQEGRKVFREVVPLVSALILAHLDELELGVDQIRRLWLHQANLNMNRLIAQRVLGRAADDKEAPVILNEYANTSSAGSVIAFHRYRDDLAPGDLGILCSFGAGYSVGSVALRRA